MPCGNVALTTAISPTSATPATTSGRRRRIILVNKYHASTRQNSLGYSAYLLIEQGKNALFDRVLVACALARRNTLGWFFPKDILEPFRAVTERDYNVSNYSPHLHSLADERGEVLEKTGRPRKFQFRFRDPLFQSFVIINALDTGLLDDDTLNRFRENLPV